MHNESDLISAEPYSVDELRTMVFEDGGPLARPLALALLGRKSYEGKVADLERLLMDDSEAPRLRNEAARLLGEIEEPEAERVLERGTEVRDELALRGVIEGLSAVGSVQARQRIEGLRRRRGAVGEAARAAALVLSHRHGGAQAEPLSVAKRTRAPLDRDRAIPIEVRPANREEVDDALTALAPAVRSLSLAPDGALSLACEGREFLVLFAANLAAGGIEFVASHPAQSGLVCGRQWLEGRAWEVWYHILTEPRQDGEIDILVTTPQHHAELAGSARVDGNRAEFELWAIEAPGALAIEVKGLYDGTTVTISDARSDARRRPSPAPSPAKR
jgi:hypothetical protein